MVAEDRFGAQRRQFEALFDAETLRTLVIADRTDGAAPDLIFLVFSVHLKQLLMLLEVSYLFGDIDRRRLFVDVKGKLDILIFNLLGLLLSHLLFDLVLVFEYALRVSELLLCRFISKFFLGRQLLLYTINGQNLVSVSIKMAFFSQQRSYEKLFVSYIHKT